MVSPAFDPVVVQKKIDALVERDAEFAKMARAREEQRQIVRFGEIREYSFPPNTSQVHVTNWVHSSWMRPARFIYRNIPRPLRRLIKKMAL
ncbi:MAG: hypothetical protein EBS27_03715 [Actinobacteria bacterium]|nr:hypothetical protein [Actinomycetota bacterium]